MEFEADFESTEKVAKNSREKSYQRKSDRKMELLTFIYCVQKYSACNFYLVNFFAHFSTDSNSALNFVCLRYPYWILNKILLTLKPKSDKTAQRNGKPYFIKKICPRISPVWEAPFCQKSQNRCTANVDSRDGWNQCDDSKNVLFSSITVQYCLYG